jgi:hypothetical protein
MDSKRNEIQVLPGVGIIVMPPLRSVNDIVMNCPEKSFAYGPPHK